MSADLELSVVQAPTDLGYVAAFAITEQMIHVAGGRTSTAPLILTSSNARHFERREPPRQLGLRDVIASGDAVWVCGEYGQLAVSRDHGASWKLVETGTDGCLHGLAIARDGMLWIV